MSTVALAKTRRFRASELRDQTYHRAPDAIDLVAAGAMQYFNSLGASPRNVAAKCYEFATEYHRIRERYDLGARMSIIAVEYGPDGRPFDFDVFEPSPALEPAENLLLAAAKLASSVEGKVRIKRDCDGDDVQVSSKSSLWTLAYALVG